MVVLAAIHGSAFHKTASQVSARVWKVESFVVKTKIATPNYFANNHQSGPTQVSAQICSLITKCAQIRTNARLIASVGTKAAKIEYQTLQSACRSTQLTIATISAGTVPAPLHFSKITAVMEDSARVESLFQSTVPLRSALPQTISILKECQSRARLDVTQQTIRNFVNCISTPRTIKLM